MAWTVTRYPTVFGNKRAIGMTLVPDAATQTIETGLKKIEWFTMGIQSMTTVASLHIAINSNASGVQSFGVLGCSGFTSGDVVHVTVYGQ